MHSALKVQQEIIKLTPKYRKQGMSMKQAYDAAKHEFLEKGLHKGHITKSKSNVTLTEIQKNPRFKKLSKDTWKYGSHVIKMRDGRWYIDEKYYGSVTSLDDIVKILTQFRKPSKGRKVSMKAIQALIESPKTPEHLKRGLLKKYSGQLALATNPVRPPKEWFYHTVKALKKVGFTDPQAGAGWLWHHQMLPETKAGILSLERGKNPIFDKLLDAFRKTKQYWVGLPWSPGKRPLVSTKPVSEAKYPHYQWFDRIEAKSQREAVNKAMQLQEGSITRKPTHTRVGKRILKRSLRKKNQNLSAILAWVKDRIRSGVQKRFILPKVQAYGLSEIEARKMYDIALSEFSRGNPKRRKNQEDDGSLVEIYSDALDTSAKKGKGSIYKDEEFIHEWEKKGTRVLGIPKGTILQLPDGDNYELTSKDVLFDNKDGKDLWDLFEQSKSRNPKKKKC